MAQMFKGGGRGGGGNNANSQVMIAKQIFFDYHCSHPTLFPQSDAFDSWCESALAGLGSEVDIPTFLTFLREIDSPSEVADYVRNYVGEDR